MSRLVWAPGRRGGEFGKTTVAVALVEACLARIEALDGALQAWSTWTPPAP